ncbi:hypothetical protein PFISCL1PPCAC_21261, partial [Pristionchus fissidentatus]
VGRGYNTSSEQLLECTNLMINESVVRISMPEDPKRRRSIWIMAVPCVFLIGFLIVCLFMMNFETPTIRFPSARNGTDTNATDPYVLPNGAVFRKRPEVSHVDCTRLLHNDRRYMKKLGKSRPNLVKRRNLNMSCAAIQKRILPARNPDTGFPILYARIVYMDYEFLEEQLATNYAEENVFCFSIDTKASPLFHYQFFSLERCLPNVVISKREHEFDSAGHNQNEAHLDCMATVRERKWEYAMLLQNHDVMIKTHYEMTEILKIYGGANDVINIPCPDHRCIDSLEKNLGKLRLCPKNLHGAEMEKCKASSIQWGKGAIQVILSRAAVDFVLDEIDVMPLMKQMNDMGYGVDEQLYQSLQITPDIRFPGGFHAKCLNNTQHVTRIVQPGKILYESAGFFYTSIWHGISNDCPAGKLRHSVCILGLEDFPLLDETQFVMANKIMPQFDYAISSCISELLFNRTRDGATIDKHRNFYENVNAVRYHRERSQPGFDINKFNCEL